MATRGNPNADEWTKTYRLEMSVNRVDWTEYKEGDAVKVRSSVLVFVEISHNDYHTMTTLYRRFVRDYDV